MPRSFSRMRLTRSTAFFALAAGSTVNTWSYLFLKYRASFARRPASAAATGDDSRPTVETVLKSTVYGMLHSRTRQGRFRFTSGRRLDVLCGHHRGTIGGQSAGSVTTRIGAPARYAATSSAIR